MLCVNNEFKCTYKHFQTRRALSYVICRFGRIKFDGTPVNAYYKLTSLSAQRAIQHTRSVKLNYDNKGLINANRAD